MAENAAFDGLKSNFGSTAFCLAQAVGGLLVRETPNGLSAVCLNLRQLLSAVRSRPPQSTYISRMFFFLPRIANYYKLTHSTATPDITSLATFSQKLS